MFAQDLSNDNPTILVRIDIRSIRRMRTANIHYSIFISGFAGLRYSHFRIVTMVLLPGSDVSSKSSISRLTPGSPSPSVLPEL